MEATVLGVASPDGRRLVRARPDWEWPYPEEAIDQDPNWEYVDLAEFMQAKSPIDAAGSPSADFFLLLGYEVDRQRRKQIPSIADYTQVFVIYPSLILPQPPSSLKSSSMEYVHDAISCLYIHTQCNPFQLWRMMLY